MRLSLARTGLIAAAATLALLVTSCAGGTGDEGGGPAAEPGDSGAVEATPAAPAAEDEDGYAFGTDRDQIATAIEEAFATKNGKTRWEGDTLVLAVTGDASTAMAGFTECRVLSGLLLEGDASVVEFPNGQVACADVLPAE